MDAFLRNAPDPVEMRRRYGVPLDAPLVSIIAQMIPRKGYRVLLQAIPAILRQFPETRFLFCGDGADRPSLESKVAEEGLSERVIFTGHIKAIPSVLAATDVVAHPAYREGLGIAILEAMGMGKAVVASAVGGIPESILPPHTGFLIQPGDHDALANHVIRLLGDDELRHRVGRASAERILREFSIDGMVSGNFSVYQSVLCGDLLPRRS
jgi:glycosyltransferase involved in cell wall biosynthesis